MADLAKLVVFKPAFGGYVYGAPNVWLFGPRNHYFANEDQKAEIIRVVTASSQMVLWTTGIAWIAISILLGAGSLLWAHRSGYQNPGLSAVLAVVVLVFSTYASLFISRQLLRCRLRPIVGAMIPTNQRITNAEMRRVIADAVPPQRLSSTRRRVVRGACVVGVISQFGTLISRAIDAYDVHQSTLIAFYVANANYSGLLSVLSIVALTFLFIRMRHAEQHVRA